MAKQRENLLYIVNPISGKGNKDKIKILIEENTDTSRYDFQIIYTEKAGHATALVEKFDGLGYRFFVAVGGDGTVNEVATAVAKTEDGVLGIIPSGSGNGLARHLHIPLDPLEAIQTINKKGHIEKIDYGVINNEHTFFCTCGVGFDAKIGRLFSKGTKRGFTSYLKATLGAFFGYRPKKYKIKFDFGYPAFKGKAFLVTVANASQYGNNAYIAPTADIQDGKFNVSIIKPFPKIAAPRIGIRLFRKTIEESKYTVTYKCRRVTIRRKKGGPFHFDGEPLRLGKKIKIKIIPLGLSVIVSESFNTTS